MPERVEDGWQLFELGERDDPRLAGWVQTTRFEAAIGTRVSVQEVEAYTGGEGGLFAEDRLMVVVVSESPGRDPVEWPLFFERRRAVDLRTLRGVVTYLTEIAGSNDLTGLRPRLGRAYSGAGNASSPAAPPALKAGAGPSIDLDALNEILPAIEAWREASDDPAIQRQLEAAYSAGRAVRRAEFPGDLARTRGRPGVKARQARAQDWQSACATWAQSIVNEWPAGRKLSNAKLALALYDRWSDRPFIGRGPVECPHGELERKHISAWRKAGTLRFPDW